METRTGYFGIVFRYLLVSGCMAWAMIAAVGCGSVELTTQADPKAARASAAAEDSPVVDYRKWTLVNPEPVRMDAAVAGLCESPAPAGLAARDVRAVGAGPHDRFISVYVNAEARPAMLAGTDASHAAARPPLFARGSMIVKEKLPTRESRTPELLTAMIKREPGYNPAGGDWEYLVLDGDARHVRERGKLASCMRCHAGAADDDYVFRGYQPR